MTIRVDLAIYPLELVLRTCHVFTGRCYISPRMDGDSHVVIDLQPRDEGDALRDLAGQFSNALLDARVRALVADETRTIRELLVAQAFCEADLLDRRDAESDEHADPRRIAG
jgi:His-Xaa-Ser system protein HxsD